jgi:hypothetical protein
MWDEIAGNAKQEIRAQTVSRLPARRIGILPNPGAVDLFAILVGLVAFVGMVR